MKIILNKLLLFITIPFILLMGCKNKLDLPISYTTGTKNVGFSSATAYGSITGRGITSKGFCWDTLDNPNLSKNVVDLGENSSSYSYEITGLKSSKRYYLRAYATNSIGTSYGAVVNFITITPPQVTTFTCYATTFSTAIATGSAFISNTLTASETGICYGTATNPDIKGSKKTNGSASNISASLTNLTENTTYYARAYANYPFGTIYGNEQSFKTPSAPIVYSVSGTMMDADGNSYNTVTIGNQTWMAENLKVITFSDGNPIPLLAGGFGSWTSASYGARCNFADNTAYAATFGYMYNFKAANDSRLIPQGWHLPSVEEWQTLFDKLGGNPSAITHLMATGNSWSFVNCTPTNFSAMSLKPGGYRTSSGTDNNMGYSAYYWTSSITGAGNYASAYVFDYNCQISLSNYLHNTGCYIRLIKD